MLHTLSFTTARQMNTIQFTTFYVCRFPFATMPYLAGLLSPRHGASSGRGWRRWAPDMEDSDRYIK